MSDALIRVIEEQQAEIDACKKHIEGQRQSMSLLVNDREEIFSLVDDLFSSKGTEKYAESWQKVRTHMLMKGWCFQCGGFECECED